MSIIIEGSSKCPICGKVLTDHYEVFPEMLPNTKDPLYLFNGVGTHTRCLHSHPLGSNALVFRSKYDAFMQRMRSLVDHDGNKIATPQDVFTILLLSSVPSEPLSQYNFTVLDRTRLDRWSQGPRFIEIAKLFQLDGKWGNLGSFDYLGYLIQCLEGNNFLKQ
jgi:DNA-directed RNA polymerase subunit N (RpoN/RPB10)